MPWDRAGIVCTDAVWSSAFSRRAFIVPGVMVDTRLFQRADTDGVRGWKLSCWDEIK